MAGQELSEEKQRARATWDAGDFAAVARLITSAGELAASRAELSGDEDVLDVACGSGNATIPAARSGAKVTGLDITPSLLEAGKREAAEAGVEIEWVEGDAEQLPYEGGSFDVVLSVFGIMFAPDHRRAASEAVRVLRPGGRLVLCNWTPEGETGRMFKTVASHMPEPPPGFQPPVLWGTEDHVRSLFEGTGVDPGFELATVRWTFDSADDAFDFYTSNFGPMIKARETLEPDGKWDALAHDLRAFFGDNAGEDGTVDYEGEFLVTTGTKAG